jgi:FlaG/FlaF family flagellin (archaellin)
MKRILPIAMAVLLVALVAAATVGSGKIIPATTPNGAVQSLFEHVKSRDYSGAFAYVAPSSNVDLAAFSKDINGRDGSLRTYSTLQEADTRVLRQSDNEATVRANLKWSTAVGAFYDTRDLKVVKEGSNWKVVWPVEKQQNLPPQVIPVTYLRWDVVRRGSDDDWGAQNVEAPRVRIISMNAIEKDNSIIILGEIVNEDIVPGFVSVNATLVGNNGQTLGEESSFDKISHTLLPKEVSPFRIDFPGLKLKDVKSVRMQPNALLVPASADPTIGVLHQQLEKDAPGKHVLRGELMNESGETVNIPHVLATFYDTSGKVIWVSDGYMDHALLPQTPLPFAVGVRDDLAAQVHSYRVTVNEYSMDRAQ